MTQQWVDLLFAHWPIPAESMRALLPSQLTLDTWDGMAWLSIVPFRMQGVRPRWLPAVPWLSKFPEINVRTYVKVRDRGVEKTGVVFFSLDATNPVAVSLARSGYKLPYYTAQGSLEERGGTYTYRSRRTHRQAPAAEFIGSYRPTGDISPSTAGTFDAWLTERYALYTLGSRGQVLIGEIHHLPWPLQPATAEIEVNTLAQAGKLSLPKLPPVLQFARHLDVFIWPLRSVESG
jgi:uncharacterized protein YqjF (DUF2071 family)